VNVLSLFKEKLYPFDFQANSARRPHSPLEKGTEGERSCRTCLANYNTNPKFFYPFLPSLGSSAQQTRCPAIFARLGQRGEKENHSDPGPSKISFFSQCPAPSHGAELWAHLIWLISACHQLSILSKIRQARSARASPPLLNNYRGSRVSEVARRDMWGICRERTR